MKKWANKERRLRHYGQGKDVYGSAFTVQDGSWACFDGVRIYGVQPGLSEEICLCLKINGAKQLIKALEKFVESNS